MPVNSGIITTPVTEPSEIQNLLGYSGLTDYGAIFNLPTIKMWAKYKPFRGNFTGIPTEADRKKAGYGITATKYDVDAAGAPATMIANAMAGDTGWTYEKPRGLAYDEWYRAWDFVGYNHNAICPFFLEDATIVGQLRIHVGQVANLPTNNMQVVDITDIIGLDDPSMSGYGFIIRNGTTVRHIDAISDDGVSMKWPLNQEHTVVLSEVAGTFDVCCYIRDYNRGNVVLHPIKGFTATVAKPAPIVRIEAGFNDISLLKPTFSFRIIGNSSQAVTADTAVLRVYNTSGKEFNSFTYSIPTLSMNQEYSDSERLELDTQIASWTFTYKGVSVEG